MRLVLVLAALYAVCQTSLAQEAEILIDYTWGSKPLKPFGQVNLGPDSSRAGYMEMGIREIRTHDFYGPCDYWHYTRDYWQPSTTSFNPLFDPRLASGYDWAATDSIIQRITTIGAVPYFRLGISWPQTGVPTIPPADADGGFTTIASIFKHTAMHYARGWDGGFTHTIPYWEIWNEPDGRFWTGPGATPIAFRRLYKAAADSLKSVDPAFKVGGPGVVAGTIVGHRTAYYDDFIAWCAANAAPLDFFSWHLYGRLNPYSLKNYADTVRAILNTNGFTAAESHITEIHPELGDARFNNTTKGAAYVASMLITAQNAPVDKIFWYRGVQFDRLAFPDSQGQARLTANGMAWKLHSWMVDSTMSQLTVRGNLLVPFHSDVDTTNLMVLAGKTRSTGMVALISNYNSTVQDVMLRFQNTGFFPSSRFRIDRWSISGTPPRLDHGVSEMNGSAPEMYVPVRELPAPSVNFISITPAVVNSVGHDAPLPAGITVAPNPATQDITITCARAGYAEAVDAAMTSLRRLELHAGTTVIRTDGWAKGVWFIRTENGVAKFVLH